MVLVSDEYCPRCNKQQPVYEDEFIGGANWRCLKCNHVVDTDLDDDYLEMFEEDAGNE